ncbi:hypothetical protein V1L54_09220 [Streptomyces sp. TRM 70361]|uniref:hypothetical protein n=1 Tax=Streptomyces sp. TRM 70361 TaxID=3116553 RepID=UPI002E7B3C75|nr:hypothetical protein [Streptomyces sp. TRM 70361]MEE1939594.1 hypothetical protein [Streptomyces sp. TRM 70361]
MARVSRRNRTAVVTAAGLLAGTAVLTGCGDDGNGGASEPGGEETRDAAEVVRAAHEETLEAETAKLDLRVRAAAGGGQQQSVTGNGVIDLVDGTSELTIEAGGQEIEQRVVEQDLYQRLPESLRGQLGEGKPWIKIDLGEIALAAGGTGELQITDPAQAMDYAGALTDGDAERVGTEEIGGVETTKYRVEVDVDELARGDNPHAQQLREQLGDTLPMHLWLDDEDRIRRQQFDIDLGAANSTQDPQGSKNPQSTELRTTLEFSDFGTEVDVSPPPAEDTTDVTDKITQRGERSATNG